MHGCTNPKDDDDDRRRLGSNEAGRAPTRLCSPLLVSPRLANPALPCPCGEQQRRWPEAAVGAPESGSSQKLGLSSSSSSSSLLPPLLLPAPTRRLTRVPESSDPGLSSGRLSRPAIPPSPDHLLLPLPMPV
ncbi:hypothetical protein CDD83_4147 [Cordyceps sp. RAO-2017]|nr:hypothetical protein CDD83_4147 [Cordyceps sp. RAO-2017]